MKTETITVINLSGSSVTMTFNQSNVIEEPQVIGIRIPTTFDSKSRGQRSLNLMIQAYKATYPTRAAFLQRVEQFGKQQVESWMHSSMDQLVLPLPDADNAWGLSIEGPPGKEEGSI